MVDLLKTFLSRDVENKIDEYLFKMKSTNFLSELNLDINSNDFSLKSYNLTDLEQLKSIWLEIANLSVNLYVEYEFFRQFSFPNRYESKIYEENLIKLGYKQYNGIWIIDKIPNKQCINENIFSSYIYIFLWQEKKQELDNEKHINENAENSIKLENLINESRNNNTVVNNTISEQFNPENIVRIVTPPIIEMGNIDNDLCEICRSELHNEVCTICMNISGPRMNNQPANWDVNDEPMLKVDELNVELMSCNLSDNATYSTANNNLQKSVEISEDSQNVNKYGDVEMRSNSSKISYNSKIKSHQSTQWTCKFCNYIHTNTHSSSNFCEVCMSSKFAKINSCVIESSFDASNENEIDSVKHDENIENKPTEYIDKWTCTKCTFNNKITVDLCEICLRLNLNKIVTVKDHELPEETWCCNGRRENNLFECYKCKKCRVPAEFFNKWRCVQCSFYNDKVEVCCGACEIKNPYLMKCNLCDEGLVNKMYDKICKKCTILSERCTNKETVDYQDNRGAQLETSTKGNQRIYQNISKNVSQNTEPKRKDSMVDEKMKCKETGSLSTSNKIQLKTIEFFNSLLQENKSSKKKIKSKTKLKSSFSTLIADSNCQKIGNLTIYNNVDRTQPETSATDKSLSKGDQNSGKLNENKIKSNKDFLLMIEKQTLSVVKTKNETNSRPCENCKSKVCANNQYWCTKCEDSQWFCRNENCDGINFQNEYCIKCKAKKGSDFSNCSYFAVMKDDGKEVQMWQCAFCMQFNAGTLYKCKCQNLRYLSCYIKCESCKWNNLNIRDKCDKCNKDLITILN